MTLREYLDTIGQKQTFFAIRLGVSKQTICRYCNGKGIPGRFVREKIEMLTDGDVKSEEWHAKS